MILKIENYLLKNILNIIFYLELSIFKLFNLNSLISFPYFNIFQFDKIIYIFF